MKALVTGGGGFVGRRIVSLLRARGDDVVVLSRQRHPEVDALGAQSLLADIRDRNAVRAAMAGIDVVFHVAAKIGTWGNRADFFATNVEGTRNVLDAAVSSGIPRFVHTSSPSVVGYAADVENGGPELPYATSHECAYAESKAEGERLVLAANGNRIATVAVRPHLVIGPGDALTLLRLAERAKRGMFRIVGDGRNRVDLTYVDNAAWAHLDAESALRDHSSRCAGRAYFISNAEPVLLWEWMNSLLRDVGLPEARGRVPLAAVRAGAVAAESVWSLLNLSSDPPITRFMASALARSHWYDMGPAAQDLGYQPRVTMAEAKFRIVEWLETALSAGNQSS